MATCAPTAWASAPTVLNWLQSSLAHTTKERSVPTTGGLARGGDASAELHVGALGPVASWPHAAVATSAQVTILAAVRCFIPTSALASRDDSQAPMLTRTCTLRGLPNDAPLKNAPFSRYRWSNAFSTYTCGRTTIWPSANA